VIDDLLNRYSQGAMTNESRARCYAVLLTMLLASAMYNPSFVAMEHCLLAARRRAVVMLLAQRAQPQQRQQSRNGLFIPDLDGAQRRFGTVVTRTPSGPLVFLAIARKGKDSCVLPFSLHSGFAKCCNAR
jgi:hypothetical protein